MPLTGNAAVIMQKIEITRNELTSLKADIDLMLGEVNPMNCPELKTNLNSLKTQVVAQLGIFQEMYDTAGDLNANQV